MNVLYISAWATNGTAGQTWHNNVTEEHPLELLKERCVEFPDDGWVLLWYERIIDGKSYDKYYQKCAEDNGGELMFGEEECSYCRGTKKTHYDFTETVCFYCKEK